MRPKGFVQSITVVLALALAGPAKADDDLGIQSLEAHVAAGDVPATTELAARLELGVGVEPNPTRAMALFCRAARFGGRIATMHIAAWLLTDDAPDYDPELAAAWLHRVQRAERGLPDRPTAKVPRCPTTAEDPLRPSTTALSQLIDQLAFEQGVDANLVKAVITVESGYQGDAISSAGAVGLMQLMPATARQYGVSDRFDIGENLRAGIGLLADLLRRYRGDEGRALAAYAVGASVIDRCQCVVPTEIDYVNRVQALRAARPPVAATLRTLDPVAHRLPKP